MFDTVHVGRHKLGLDAMIADQSRSIVRRVPTKPEHGIGQQCRTPPPLVAVNKHPCLRLFAEGLSSKLRSSCPQPCGLPAP